MISIVRLLITSFFFVNLIIPIACCLKDLHIFLMQFLLPYVSCLFSMLLSDDIVDIENRDRICSPKFVVGEF